MRKVELRDDPASNRHPEGTDISRSAWTQYWNGGNFESLPEDRANGLLAAFDAAWMKFFAAFRRGARLLDLATGGGDVIRRAIAAGREFRITGVDFADLSAVSATLAGVELVGNTDLSRLPFADRSFDGVTSQFGIEYADHSAAARETIRVLAPGGRARFVLHHASSAITQGVADNLAAHRSVFTDDSAFQHGRRMFELRQQCASAAAVADAEAEFRHAVGTLQSRMRNDRAFATAGRAVVFLTRLANAPGSLEPADALRRMDVVEEQIRARNLRKQAQLDAALDEQGMHRLAELLASAGAIVEKPQVLNYPGGKILGWSISLSKK